MDELEGRVAVVTGAASGIGLAIAEALTAERVHVVLTDIDADALARAAVRISHLGGVVDAVHLDVRDAVAVERTADHVVKRFGALHIAVNNAGIVNGGKSWELELDEWRRVLDVNLWGVIHGLRAFVPRILDTGDEGHVVNISSWRRSSLIARSVLTQLPSTACSGCPTCCDSNSKPTVHRSVSASSCRG